MTKRLRRFEPRLNNAGSMASIVPPPSAARVVSLLKRTETTEDGAVSPSYSAPCGRFVEGGAWRLLSAKSPIQKNYTYRIRAMTRDMGQY